MKGLFFLLLAALGAAALAYCFHAPLLQAYARFFTVHTARRGADAIVVLSGSAETRISRAMELYRQGYAPRILLTRARPLNALEQRIGCTDRQRAGALLALLEADGEVVSVPSLKGGATSTFDEAYDLRDWSLQHGYRRIIIVSDNFHTRRALLAFEKIFKATGIAVEAAGAPNDCFSENDWWQSDRGLSAYITEGMKYLVYCVSRRNAAGIKNF